MALHGPDQRQRGTVGLTPKHSPVGMALVSAAGELLSVNDAFCEVIGYDASTLRSMNIADITHPDDLGSDLDLMQETLAGERPSYRLRKRYLCAYEWVVWGDLTVAHASRWVG